MVRNSFRLLFALALLIGLAARAAAGAREDFLKLIDRPKVAADAQVGAPSALEGGGERILFSFMSFEGMRVPGQILRPAGASGKLPAVIVLHGTSGNMSSEQAFMRKLVDAGFIAVAIDAPYHGQRADERGRSAKYQDAILAAWRAAGTPKEHPFFYDTVWDMMRLIDYLQTRDDIDASRIGMYGVSKGGIETCLTAAVDPRVAAAVPCIGVQSFGWALDNDMWQRRIETIPVAYAAAVKDAGLTTGSAEFTAKFYDKINPGIRGEFDGPAMLPMIAPRPLMTINGDSDGRTPPAALKLATDAAQAAYDKAGAAEKFKVVIEKNTGHRVNPDAQDGAVEWFKRWLKP